jgi:nicotinamide riboside kinase
MTTVIGLLGGPGVGKSTAACEVYSQLKAQYINVELVREYVKEWAWEKRPITQLDYPGIFGNQFKSESVLYNKVDYIITDCPIVLICIYEEYYFGKSLMLSSCISYLDFCRQNDINHVYFFLERQHKYVQTGRYENEEEAKKLDEFIKKKLTEWKIPFHNLKDLKEINL